MQHSKCLNVKLAEDNTIRCKLNGRSDKMVCCWITVPAYDNTTYSFTVTGRACGRVYLWASNQYGENIYNRKVYLPKKMGKVVAHFRNKIGNTMLVGLYFHSFTENHDCVVSSIDLKVKKTGEEIYRWGTDQPIMAQSFQDIEGDIFLGSRLYQTTGDIEHSDTQFTFKGKAGPLGIKTVIGTEQRVKYTITVRGRTHFSKGGSLYLWIGGTNEKMIHFKPLEFKSFDTMGIGSASITFNSRKFTELKIAIYFRGHVVIGDGFIIEDIRIDQVNSKGSGNDDVVLVMGDFARMRNSVALNRLRIWEYFSARNPRIILFGTDHEKWREGISIHQIVNVLGVFPKLIVHMQYNLEDKLICRGLDGYQCRKAALIEDMHRPDAFIKAMERGRFKFVIYNCDCAELDVLRNKLPGKAFVHMPHFVDTRIFRDYGLEKRWDIIFYGTHGSDYYPFRDRLYKLLQTCGRFTVKFITFTGYKADQAKKMPRGEQLAMLINQCWIGISTSSRVDYFVKKYLEIPACGTMVAGNIPTRKANILKGNIIELKPTMDDQTIVQVLAKALENKKKLSKRIRKLKRLVEANYSFEAGFKMMSRTLLS